MQVKKESGSDRPAVVTEVAPSLRERAMRENGAAPARFSYDRGSFPGRWIVLERWRARKEWKFFAVLPQADAGLAVAWWSVLLLRGVLPALFSLAMGFLVAAVQRRHSLTPSFT